MSATAIKERPVIFSGPMIKAIFEGRKSQTRRVVKAGCLAHSGIKQVVIKPRGDRYVVITERGNTYEKPFPYCLDGHRLWVRETWNPPGFFANLPISATKSADRFYYLADDPSARGTSNGFMPWRSPIHMPRWASRLTLEITAIRVERLQEISPDDVMAEGVEFPVTEDGRIGFRVTGKHCPHEYWPVESYQELRARPDFKEQYFRSHFASAWDCINGKTHPWKTNPWVWVISFKPVGGAACS